MKTPEQIIDEAITANYEDPDSTDVLQDLLDQRTLDAGDVRSLAEASIQINNDQIAAALRGSDAISDIRPFARASISQLIDAYAEWDGEVDTFVAAWENYTTGLDFPCPDIPHGVHSTYLTDDGSCDFCGDKNRG